MKLKITVVSLFLFSTQIFSGIGTGTSQPGALPVELSSFTASINVSNVELRWTTETEVNNYGFEVERVLSLTSFISNWERVGFVQGHGNSNSPKEYYFTDIPNGGTKFQYRLKQIDNDGKYAYSEVLSIDIKIPNQYILNQNYPNPFNPSTVISYSIPASSKVTLTVYDVLGKFITTLVNENQEAGSYLVNFNAAGLSNGMYFYNLQSDNFVKTNKMLLLK
jgi:hypothetical protein